MAVPMQNGAAIIISEMINTDWWFTGLAGMLAFYSVMGFYGAVGALSDESSAGCAVRRGMFWPFYLICRR